MFHFMRTTLRFGIYLINYVCEIFLHIQACVSNKHLFNSLSSILEDELVFCVHGRRINDLIQHSNSTQQ